MLPTIMHRSHQNSKVNRAWTRVVPGWVTSWEVLVMPPSFFYLSLHSDSWVGCSLLWGQGSPSGYPAHKCNGSHQLGSGKLPSHTLRLNSGHGTRNRQILTRMSNDNVQGAQNLLNQERDERTDEFSQTMLSGNLGEASKAQPNFDPINRANGVQLNWKPRGFTACKCNGANGACGPSWVLRRKSAAVRWCREKLL